MQERLLLIMLYKRPPAKWKIPRQRRFVTKHCVLQYYVSNMFHSFSSFSCYVSLHHSFIIIVLFKSTRWCIGIIGRVVKYQSRDYSNVHSFPFIKFNFSSEASNILTLFVAFLKFSVNITYTGTTMLQVYFCLDMVAFYLNLLSPKLV